MCYQSSCHSCFHLENISNAAGCQDFALMLEVLKVAREIPLTQRQSASINFLLNFRSYTLNFIPIIVL